MNKPMKQKTCKGCREKFTPQRPLAQVCSVGCAYKYAEANRQKRLKELKKESNKELAILKEKLMTRSEWMNLLQKVFNTYIRERDKNNPCISCGNPKPKKINAGHYRSVGSCPELRFNEYNVHLQCEYCNTYLHGNLINYRINLIERYGEERVKWLEKYHEPKKYSVDEIKQLIKTYKEKIKQIGVNK
jgi:hypothetical protein